MNKRWRDWKTGKLGIARTGMELRTLGGTSTSTSRSGTSDNAKTAPGLAVGLEPNFSHKDDLPQVFKLLDDDVCTMDSERAKAKANEGVRDIDGNPMPIYQGRTNVGREVSMDMEAACNEVWVSEP